MQTVIDFFGFTDPVSGIWNTVAYTAFIGIIIGVLWERCRDALITLGALALALYAGMFLHNPVFAALQALIVVSGLLKLAASPKRVAMGIMIALTVAAYLSLALSGAIVDAWALVGSFGLLGIAFGLTVLPKNYGFLLMAAGGVLLIFYGFAVEAWVFFSLNIVFAIVSIRNWKKEQPP